jgi:hypothetical protein
MSSFPFVLLLLNTVHSVTLAPSYLQHHAWCMDLTGTPEWNRIPLGWVIPHFLLSFVYGSTVLEMFWFNLSPQPFNQYLKMESAVGGNCHWLPQQHCYCCCWAEERRAAWLWNAVHIVFFYRVAWLWNAVHIVFLYRATWLWNAVHIVFFYPAAWLWNAVHIVFFYRVAWLWNAVHIVFFYRATWLWNAVHIVFFYRAAWLWNAVHIVFFYRAAWLWNAVHIVFFYRAVRWCQRWK